MKLAFYSIMIVLFLTSCGNSDQEVQKSDDEIESTYTPSPEHLNYMALLGAKYSYQIDSLLEINNVIEMELPFTVDPFDFDDVYRVKNDSTDSGYGVVFPVFSEIGQNNKLIFDLLAEEEDLRALMRNKSSSIILKIVFFKRMNSIFQPMGELDEEYYSYIEVSSWNAPFYIKGKIIEIK